MVYNAETSNKKNKQYYTIGYSNNRVNYYAFAVSESMTKVRLQMIDTFVRTIPKKVADMYCCFDFTAFVCSSSDGGSPLIATTYQSDVEKSSKYKVKTTIAVNGQSFGRQGDILANSSDNFVYFISTDE